MQQPAFSRHTLKHRQPAVLHGALRVEKFRIQQIYVDRAQFVCNVLKLQRISAIVWAEF